MDTHTQICIYILYMLYIPVQWQSLPGDSSDCVTGPGQETGGMMNVHIHTYTHKCARTHLTHTYTTYTYTYHTNISIYHTYIYYHTHYIYVPDRTPPPRGHTPAAGIPPDTPGPIPEPPAPPPSPAAAVAAWFQETTGRVQTAPRGFETRPCELLHRRAIYRNGG